MFCFSLTRSMPSPLCRRGDKSYCKRLTHRRVDYCFHITSIHYFPCFSFRGIVGIHRLITISGLCLTAPTTPVWVCEEQTVNCYVSTYVKSAGGVDSLNCLRKGRKLHELINNKHSHYFCYLLVALEEQERRTAHTLEQIKLATTLGRKTP